MKMCKEVVSWFVSIFVMAVVGQNVYQEAGIWTATTVVFVAICIRLMMYWHDVVSETLLLVTKKMEEVDQEIYRIERGRD